MAREIPIARITEAVARLCREANLQLPPDVLEALSQAQRQEESPLGRQTLGRILENAALAAQEGIPLCQDCGTALIFLEMGQDSHIAGGDLHEAIQEGVRRGYRDGYLRPSIVRQPFTARRNTGDNTPAVVHTEVVPGEGLKLSVMTKGGGAENKGRLAMLSPGAGAQGIAGFVAQAVAEAGSDPCPPVILGLGIGGTAEKAMLLSKKALLRRVGEPHPDPEVAELERLVLSRVNDLGIGPAGFGGRITALAVHAETFPCHIASLPLAVSFQCHSARHREASL
ncbi:MAG: fumarate hydratase [Chloroflexi bacterium]|nr:fumarate hydratase [Chloroflexota bacterium]